MYASAALNLGINNGPMWMAISMDVPVIMFRPTTNKAGMCFDDKFFRTNGLPPGSQLPTSPDYQKLVWEDDKADLIVKEVLNFFSQPTQASQEKSKKRKRVRLDDDASDLPKTSMKK